MTAPYLARVLGAARGDEGPHVLTADRAPHLGECEEPQVISARDASGVRELSPDRCEDRAATREDADDLELRHLAQTAERAHASQERTREPAPWSAHTPD